MATATLREEIPGTRGGRRGPRRATFRGVCGTGRSHLFPATAQLQAPITAPQRFGPRLAIVLAAEKPAELGCGPDRRTACQRVSGRPGGLRGGRKALQDGDFGGREGPGGGLTRIPPHRIDHPKETPSRHGIEGDGPRGPLPGLP